MAILTSNMESSAQSMTVADLLQKLVASHSAGCLSIQAGQVEWEIVLQDQGQIFAAHSLDPVEKMDRHLRRLGFRCPSVTPEVREATKRQLSGNLKTLSRVEAECAAIQDLCAQGYIGQSDAEELAFKLTTESLEVSLPLPEFQHHFLKVEFDSSAFKWPVLDQTLQNCRSQISAWQALTPQIHSPYQRPRLSEASGNLSGEQQQSLSKLLVGFSFRQLSAALNQDELKIAQSLQPLIQNGAVSLLEPQSPFNQLPSFRIQPKTRVSPSTAGAEIHKLQLSSLANAAAVSSKSKRIVCVDDSPTLLRIMQQYLGEKDIEIYTIVDSLQALREIIRLKPDLILLDVGMPNLDGYKLCSLIRNHSLFKTTPVVMVTGNTGFLDRARARAVGATDYLTKPFNQTDLRSFVYQYLELTTEKTNPMTKVI